MNIGGGSIADCILPAKKGRIMSVFFGGIFIGPVIGPLIGGFIAQSAGWRWTLWVVAIVVCSISRGFEYLSNRDCRAEL